VNPYTVEKHEYHKKYVFSPRIQFNDDTPASVFNLDEEIFKFLTCDGTILNNISFMAYISAFDLPTWAVLLFFIVVTSFVQYLIIKLHYWSLFKQRFLKISFVVDNRFRILFEQVDNMIEKFPRRISIIILNLPWIWMGIILSNAYRGNNIRELCAPIKLEMNDTLEQLVAKNFTLYTYPMALLWRNLINKTNIRQGAHGTWSGVVCNKSLHNWSSERFTQEISRRWWKASGKIGIVTISP